jgi:hypothetical protein
MNIIIKSFSLENNRHNLRASLYDNGVEHAIKLTQSTYQSIWEVSLHVTNVGKTVSYNVATLLVEENTIESLSKALGEYNFRKENRIQRLDHDMTKNAQTIISAIPLDKLGTIIVEYLNAPRD